MMDLFVCRRFAEARTKRWKKTTTVTADNIVSITSSCFTEFKVLYIVLVFMM